MTQPRPFLHAVKTRLRMLTSTPAPVRYGVATVIALSLGYSFFYFVPMIRRDQQALRDLCSVDIQGMSLESDLQFQVQESRRGFLRVLLATGRPDEFQQELRSMRGYDAQVAQTESEIAALGIVPAENQVQFHRSWEEYRILRDKMCATALHGDMGEVRKTDKGMGNTAFRSVEESLRSANLAFEASSAKNVEAVSSSLREALKDLTIFGSLRIAVLLLLLWVDWKRIRLGKQLKTTARELAASEDRFRQAYDSASVGMGIIALDGTVVSANRMAARILGYELNEIIGIKVKDFMAPEFQEAVARRFGDPAPGPGGSYQVERRVIRKDGTAAWVRNSVTLLRCEGKESHYFSISEDITAQKEANDRLAYLANFDPVTNLPNRHHFENLLDAALLPTGAADAGVALLYLELDSFDFLKGTFGRTVADEVLSELGSYLTAFVRQDELVGRLDDHVFGVLLKSAPYDQAAMARAAELRDIFHQASGSGKHRIPISASIGIAYSANDPRDPATIRAVTSSQNGSAPVKFGNSGAGADAETLLKYARAAMLEARSRGGDSIYLADPGLQQRAAQRHQIESALLCGLREDEFSVVFQPQFEVESGRLIRFEALCRWTSAELGPIPPDRFIPIAEQTGLITEIGRRVLQDALRQAATWTGAGRRIGVAVNISPMQFMRPDFTQTITEALVRSNFPPALLELEITEGIFIRDLNLAVARIRELQRLGLSIALDDFGTGYSSLSYLQRMPIDAVKLDRSFVSDLTTDAATVSMVRSVLAMAEALNLRVVTEGVETAQQLDILRALGCDEAQGYLLGRPESAESALRRVLESPLLAVGSLAQFS